MPYTITETATVVGGVVRFGIPLNRLVLWPALARRARMKREIQQLLENTGRKQGAAPGAWAGSIEPIPLNGLAIEVFDAGSWVPVQELANDPA